MPQAVGNLQPQRFPRDKERNQDTEQRGKVLPLASRSKCAAPATSTKVKCTDSWRSPLRLHQIAMVDVKTRETNGSNGTSRRPLRRGVYCALPCFFQEDESLGPTIGTDCCKSGAEFRNRFRSICKTRSLYVRCNRWTARQAEREACQTCLRMGATLSYLDPWAKLCI